MRAVQWGLEAPHGFSLIVSGDPCLGMRGHFDSKFLHLKEADGPHLSREQVFAWPSGPSKREP